MNDIAYDILLDTGIRIQPLPVWEHECAHPESYSNPHLLYKHLSRRHYFVKAAELMAKAHRALASAHMLLQDDDSDGACNRAYYPQG